MIEAIFTSAVRSGVQESNNRVELVCGKGIVSDRYCKKNWSSGKNITFIEAEQIDKYNADYNQKIEMHATRRNVITRGVRLNDLVGKEFMIGEVTFKGVELCEPCSQLGNLLQNQVMKKKDVVKAFVNRGGLRADVLSDGHIAVGMTFDFNKV